MTTLPQTYSLYNLMLHVPEEYNGFSAKACWVIGVSALVVFPLAGGTPPYDRSQQQSINRAHKQKWNTYQRTSEEACYALLD